jgi:glycine/D-amino acid oxidase-like deaminating enzyme
MAKGFRIHRADGVCESQKIVLCAGLGNARLAPMVGLDAPVKPNRGQVLVTECVRPFIRYPTGRLRQVAEGAVQIGDSKEDVGFDDGTTGEVVGAIAKRAVRCFPLLENVRVVRSWGALRVMSPDGHPIYQRSTSCPGASLVTCHSGVTLAAAHAKVLAGWVAGDEPIVGGGPAGGGGPDYLEGFGVERFRLQKTG